MVGIELKMINPIFFSDILRDVTMATVYIFRKSHKSLLCHNSKRFQSNRIKSASGVKYPPAQLQHKG